MIRYPLRSGVATLALAAFVAAGTTALPFEISDDLGMKAKVAEAKGGRGGGGGGRGGGGGNGGGNGNGGGHGGGHGAANAGKSGPSDTDIGASAHGNAETGHQRSAMGSLNASNASPTAREHASKNSVVGAIADYENATTDEEAAAALARAANKEITAESVNGVNQNLGIEATPEEEAEMAALAEEARTAEEEDLSEETATEEGEEDGTTEEETDEIASAADALIDGEEESETSTE